MLKKIIENNMHLGPGEMVTCLDAQKDNQKKML